MDKDTTLKKPVAKPDSKPDLKNKMDKHKTAPAKSEPSKPAPAKPAQKTPSPKAAIDNSPPPSFKRSRRKRRWAGKFLFLLLVIVPTILVGYYYNTTASDQYQSEMRFSVRGTNTSPLDALGLSAIPGSSTQAADAYIVIDYVTSPQVLIDIQEKRTIDLRSYFSKDDIDPLYRIEPDMPLEEFIYYWNWMIDANFNSTTGITSFRVNAFSSDDASQITKLVLGVAKDLVSGLSQEARKQLIETAQNEVTRTELRMVLARKRITAFRDKEQSLNPNTQASSDQVLIQGLQKDLIDLKSRRAALLASVNKRSPSVKIIDRQIKAVANELNLRRKEIGSGKNVSDEKNRNLSALLSEYTGLELEQEFSEKAYTAALSSLEKAQTEARKQERYFALVLDPTVPAVALYPLRIINTIIAFGAFFIVWLLSYLIVQAIREHSV